MVALKGGACSAPCPLLPMEDRIVARPLPMTDVTVGGIHLPWRWDGPTLAEVLAVGPGRVTDWGATIPAGVEVGDVVLLPEHGPTEIDVDGETLLCCPPMMVLAVDRPAWTVTRVGTSDFQVVGWNEDGTDLVMAPTPGGT